jgi:hypothetical protein
LTYDVIWGPGKGRDVGCQVPKVFEIVVEYIGCVPGDTCELPTMVCPQEIVNPMYEPFLRTPTLEV